MNGWQRLCTALGIVLFGATGIASVAITYLRVVPAGTDSITIVVNVAIISTAILGIATALFHALD